MPLHHMNFIELWNGFIADQQCRELRKDRPLHEWPSEILVWLFWSDELTDLDLGCMVLGMIHHEMNARGEGEKVAV